MISIADIGASVMKVLTDAMTTGNPLYGENILFPGDYRNTASMNTWAVPIVSDDGIRANITKGGLGQLNVMIFSRLNQGLYARDELAAAFHSALLEVEFAVKNYISGNGSSTLGLGQFFEGTFSKSMTDEDGIYASNFFIPFVIRES